MKFVGTLIGALVLEGICGFAVATAFGFPGLWQVTILSFIAVNEKVPLTQRLKSCLKLLFRSATLGFW